MNKQWFSKGLRDGIPIAAGYFAVSFALGIAARNAGLNAFQATLASLLCNASAGEFAGFTVIASNASYLTMAVITAITNARYLLMSAALSQKLPADTKLGHRLLVGFWITDEIFGASATVPGKLNPFYNYGLAVCALSFWALGTCLGVVVGNILPANVVSALGVEGPGRTLAGGGIHAAQLHLCTCTMDLTAQRWHAHHHPDRADRRCRRGPLPDFR